MNRFFRKIFGGTQAAPAASGTDAFGAELQRLSTLSVADGKAIDWASMPAHVAWFDRPDALDRIEARLAAKEISEQDAALLRAWVADGCLSLDGIIPEADIDGVNAFVDDLLATSEPNDDITLLGYTLDPQKGGDAVPHRELVKLDPARRQAQARLSPWRIHQLKNQCEAANRIFENARLKEIASLIFDREAYPRSTINFYLGSQQELHQDMAVFHVFPGNYLIGVWIALEDISPDSGPLRYVPGSHREPPYAGFANHPQSTLRTCPLSEYEGYYRYTNGIADEFGGARSYLAKKGDVFLWHGMLVHGGSAVNDPALTRRSMVIHYLVDGVDQTDRVVGPFNWG